MTSLTVYITARNPGDKLTQLEWSHLCTDIDLAVDDAARLTGVHIHGRQHSLANEPFQDACWCVEIDAALPGTTVRLRQRLVELAGLYRLDSITWGMADVERLRPR